MGLKKTIALALGLLIFWLLCISLFRLNLGSTIRFFNDDHDRSVYASESKWFFTGQIPYKDTISEYPQIPTYLFAVPYLIPRVEPGEKLFYWFYSTFFSFLMLGFLMVSIILLYKILPKNKNRAFLMLLPATLYFTYNRYDILPSLLVLVSLFCLQRKKYVLTGIFLGMASLTKWYPVLLFPVFLAHANDSNHRIEWKMILAFCLTCLIIISPTVLTGGFKALLVPYEFHAQRGFEQISVPALIHRAFPVSFGNTRNISFLIYLFLILSVLPAPASALARVDTFEKVMLWSVIVVAFFILFSRIWSPQWILWVLPLLILIVRTRSDIIWIAAYGVVNYLAFPVVFDHYGMESWQLIVGGLAGFVILVRFVIVCFRRADGGVANGWSPLQRSRRIE